MKVQKVIYDDNTIPKNTGVSYNFTPDGYVNAPTKFTDNMGKKAGQFLRQDIQLMKPFSSTGNGRLPRTRSNVIQRPHDEEATYFYSTQKMLEDMRWPSPWDKTCQGDAKYYKSLEPYRRPPFRRKRNPYIAAIPYISKAQILSENAGINIFQMDDPSQVSIQDLKLDESTYGRDRTIDTTALNTNPREKVRFMDARLRNAASKNQKDMLLAMIRRGQDYDQETFPQGITAIPETYDQPFIVDTARKQQAMHQKQLTDISEGTKRNTQGISRLQLSHGEKLREHGALEYKDAD